VDIGIGATKAPSHFKLSDAERMRFEMDCQQFLSAKVTEVVERSPLRYRVFRVISCLVVSNIVKSWLRGACTGRYRLCMRSAASLV